MKRSERKEEPTRGGGGGVAWDAGVKLRMSGFPKTAKNVFKDGVAKYVKDPNG